MLLCAYNNKELEQSVDFSEFIFHLKMYMQLPPPPKKMQCTKFPPCSVYLLTVLNLMSWCIRGPITDYSISNDQLLITTVSDSDIKVFCLWPKTASLSIIFNDIVRSSSSSSSCEYANIYILYIYQHIIRYGFGAMEALQSYPASPYLIYTYK